MNQRTRITAQDKILEGIASTAASQPLDVGAAMVEIGQKLAKKWGCEMPDIPTYASSGNTGSGDA